MHVLCYDGSYSVRASHSKLESLLTMEPVNIIHVE